ncbi:MAG: YciI family protein [Burkholderiales bacterium]
MRLGRILVLLCAALLSGCAQVAPITSAISRPQGDWFVFLESGKPTPTDEDAVAAMQKGHLANFGKLFAEKKLLAAGPLTDPTGLKRGIVVLNAPDLHTLRGYFKADRYVSEGYMTLNASRAIAQKPLNTAVIDPNQIEEGRVILISRPPLVLDTEADNNDKAFLQALVDNQVVGAWYTLADGPVLEVLFARGRDTQRLREIFARHPSAGAMGATVMVWPQWLSKGVVP